LVFFVVFDHLPFAVSNELDIVNQILLLTVLVSSFPVCISSDFLLFEDSLHFFVADTDFISHLVEDITFTILLFTLSVHNILELIDLSRFNFNEGSFSFKVTKESILLSLKFFNSRGNVSHLLSLRKRVGKFLDIFNNFSFFCSTNGAGSHTVLFGSDFFSDIIEAVEAVHHVLGKLLSLDI